VPPHRLGDVLRAGLRNEARQGFDLFAHGLKISLVERRVRCFR
jgi:hypothetical protein